MRQREQEHRRAEAQPAVAQSQHDERRQNA